MNLFIAEKVDDHKIKIISSHEYTQCAFDRLGDILYRLGYKYQTDYIGVIVYINNENKSVGEILKISDLHHKIYYSDIFIGEFSNNMIIQFIK